MQYKDIKQRKRV